MTGSCATASLKNIRAANGEFSPAALRAILVSRLGFSDETRFVVALSGGADSVALLSALVAAGWRPRAVHVDHGLHPASEPGQIPAPRCATSSGFPARLNGFRSVRSGSVGTRQRHARPAMQDSWRCWGRAKYW